MPIPKLIVESSQAPTILCEIGAHFGTDKSPYNTVMAHRHPYTAVYHMLFAPLRHKVIHFGEIGIAGGSSVLMWRSYFTNAALAFFDIDNNGVENCRRSGIPNSQFEWMDVTQPESIRDALSSCKEHFDIILDDSSHVLQDQVRIIHQALPFVKPGGMIIIEDIHRAFNEADYESGLADIKDEFEFIYFIDTEHFRKHSPGYDNDKLLICVKK